MEPRSIGRSVLMHLRRRLAVRYSPLFHNHVAGLSVRNLTTSCTSPESSRPRETGAPRITHVGKQRSQWVSQTAGDQQHRGACLGISSREPSLLSTGLGSWAPAG